MIQINTAVYLFAMWTLIANLAVPQSSRTANLLLCTQEEGDIDTREFYPYFQQEFAQIHNSWRAIHVISSHMVTFLPMFSVNLGLVCFWRLVDVMEVCSCRIAMCTSARAP